MIELSIGLLAAIFLTVTGLNIRGFYKFLGMNPLQSTVLGLLIWVPMFIMMAGLAIGIGTDIVLFLLKVISDLSYELVCGLSGTSSEEVSLLHKKYLQKIGKNK